MQTLKNKKVMGVTFDIKEQKFVFDFGHDGTEDIVSLTGNGYEVDDLDDTLENGRPRYTAVQKEEVKQSINKMLDLIHQKDYFTIAKDVKKNRFRPYMMHFLKFSNKADEELCASIRKQNILIIDDVTTSGSTLNEVLRTLRILNEDNNIVIFSLIGRKDLMAE